MRGKPGTIARMTDGRLVIVYNSQPLLKEKGKVVIHLIDDDFRLIEEKGKAKTLLMDIQKYNESIRGWTAIGKVD